MIKQKILPIEMYEENFSEWAEKKEKIIKTGIPEIDQLNGGGIPKGITLILGESSIGKTALALNMAENIAERGRNVLFFSTEMNRNVCIARGISRRSEEIGYGDIITGKVDKRKYQKAKEDYFKKCGKHLFLIECFGGITPSEMKEIIRQYPDPIVFVDYLQQLKLDEKGIKEERIRIKKTGSQMLQLCNEEKIAMVVLSSVSRENYGKRLGIESGKECGELEYNAECVMGMQYTKSLKKDLTREEREIEKQAPEGRKISITVLKNRNTTGTGVVNLRFVAKYNKFVNPDIKKESQNSLKQAINIYS